MIVRRYMSVAALAVAVAIFSGSPARAGGDCCEGKEVAQKPKEAQCPILVCDAHQAKKTEAVLKKLAEPAPKRAADEDKAIAEAKKELLASCPFGGAITGGLGTIIEGLQAVGTVDAVMAQGGKGLPADCQTQDGKCAFCAEAGGKLGEETKYALQVTGKAVARAQKIATPLAALAATYGGATTVPAGMPSAIPPIEVFQGLAQKLEKLAADFAEAGKKAEGLSAEAKAKRDAAGEKLGKLAPEAFGAVCAGYAGLFGELDLAGKATKAVHEDGFFKDAKAHEAISQNAKNAMNLFEARGAVLLALGKVAAATGMAKCGEGSACGSEASEPAGCHGAEKAAKKGGCCGDEGAAKKVTKP